MDFSNMDWGFLISVASAMVATIKIVFIVYSSGKGPNKRAKLEHHDLFRLFKKIKSQVNDHPDLDPSLKIAIVELMELVESEWGKSNFLEFLMDTNKTPSDIQTIIYKEHLEWLDKIENSLSKKGVPKKYITHIVDCMKKYKTNFGSDLDYIIFSDAHKDRYQMAVMLMDMTTAIITSSVPDLINVTGGNNEAH